MKKNVKEDSRSKSVFWVLFNNYITLPINVIYNLLSKKILGELAPKLTSDAILAGSFHKYFDLAFFPFVSSLSREIPLNKDKDPLFAQKIADVVFTISFILSTLAFIFFAVLGFVTEDLILKLIYFAFGLASVFKFLHRTINVYLGSYGQFVRKSKISMWVVLIKVPVCLLLIYYFHEYGYVISIFLTMSLVGVFMIFIMDWSEVSINLDFMIAKILVIRAIPFTLYVGIETVLFTMDKFLIRNISQIELGIYGFAFQVSFMIYETPKMIYATLFPFYLKELKDKILPNVFEKITDVQTRILFFTSIIIIFAYCIFVLIIKYFLPHFAGAEKFASVLFIIPYVYSFNYVFYLYCISKRFDREISIISIVSIISALLLFSLAYFLNFSSFQISLVVVIVLLINSSQIVFYLTSRYGLKLQRILRLYSLFFILLIPYVLVCLPYYYASQIQFSFLLVQIIALLGALFILFIVIKVIDPELPKFLIQKLRKVTKS